MASTADTRDGGRVQTETSQALTIVSIPMILLVAWVVAAVTLGFGVLKRQRRFVQAGVVLAGLMTLVTPLAWYAYAAAHPDVYTIGVADVVILGLLAFLGGAVLRSGLNVPAPRATPPAKR